ncbi:hypothetical protein Cgig2_008280 [Carnegiea gigantea]|uniref:Symplekin n=1 Tax=Carnegiea gigantea TaxID=171969 RepID=A0A9Q1L2W5_9CARY|nr:hypothetical protein Cgig2_008280 [Carnegiea gigantea]
MAVNSREQALSLLAAANNHGDLAVKLSSLRQVKDIVSSAEPSIASEVFPFLVELQTSHESLVRKFLLEVIEEIGLRALEHSSVLMPVLLVLLKDEDHSVACQCIISGMKFFCAILEEMAWQFHRHGKVERWAEDIWMAMIEFKDAVCSFVFEPVSVRIRLLAFKFLETCVLLFTPDAANFDRPTSGGNDRRFNVLWLASGHPVLDPAELTSEANRLSTRLLDMLQSSSSLPGSLTIAIVNWVALLGNTILFEGWMIEIGSQTFYWGFLAAIARKRPDHYGRVLSALLDFHSNLETTRGGHAASLQYSVRSALLGFLRSTHPAISESRDRLVRLLRSMNAGDAADQALRQVDKMMRNNERSSRDARASKEDQHSNQQVPSGDAMKRRLMPLDIDDTNGPETVSKRMRYNSNGKNSELLKMNESGDSNPIVNGVSPKVPVLNSNLNPVEQMIAVIGALLAEGERGAESLELLISQIHPDLLADIVITNMKHLPKTPPVAKPGSLDTNAESTSAARVVQGAASDATMISVQPSVPLPPQGSLMTMTTVNASLPDFSSPTNLQVDSRRDPRRDPRRLDPRRVATPVEAPLPPAVDDISHVPSGSESPASANKLPPVSAAPDPDQISPLLKSDVEIDGKIMRTSLVSDSEPEMPKEEIVDGAREISSSSEVKVPVDHTPTLSDDLVVDESPAAPLSLDIAPTDAADGSFLQESDEYSPAVSNTSASEETSLELPQVPSYVELSEDQRQAVGKLAVERIVRSNKLLKSKDFCQTRMALLARLMDADDIMAMMVQEDMVLDYRDQQGHELVMHVLYHLHGARATVSSDQSSGAADLYEKFLLGVAKSLLDTLPASDKSFSRLLGEAPTLTDSVMRLLENLCCPEGLEQREKNIRDDRITQGLGAVWSLILGRPLDRQACLDIALKCAVHSEDDIRAKAIRLVANKLYPLKYLSEAIEQYAINMLLSAVDFRIDADASHCGSADARRAEMGRKDTSISGHQHSESATSVDDLVKDTNAASEMSASIPFPEAQRLISLYFALCTKKPGLLQLVFDVYARSGRSVKQALQVLAEQTTPPPDLVATVKHLYETKLKDASIVIPILPSLSKKEVLPIFPRLVGLPLDKFQQALAHILQGSAHTGPALTPAEVLVAIHDIVTDACSACFEQRTVFTQHVLAKALNQMVDRTPLPLLFMRTVIQAIDAFPTLVDFVMEILSKLVNRQLPGPQLESALNKYANLRSSLAAYSSQPSVKSSLPRPSFDPQQLHGIVFLTVCPC